jgi:hypothetical protein
MDSPKAKFTSGEERQRETAMEPEPFGADRLALCLARIRDLVLGILCVVDEKDRLVLTGMTNLGGTTPNSLETKD